MASYATSILQQVEPRADWDEHKTAVEYNSAQASHIWPSQIALTHNNTHLVAMCVAGGSNSMTSGPAIDDVLTFAEAGRIDDAHRLVSTTLGFMFGGVLPMRAVPTSCPAAASDGDEGYPGTVDVDRRYNPGCYLAIGANPTVERSWAYRDADAFGAAEWRAMDDAHALVATVEARHFDAEIVVGGDLVAMRATLYRRAGAEALARWNRGLHVAAALVVEPRDTQP